MKSLILYYSYRGNTQRIAERIHSAIGGDIARIDTVVPYTGSYDDVVAQGEREVKRGFLPELKAMDIDLDRYDTIVLGTPVWWYTCAPATRAFLTAHDLSGIGESGAQLAALAGTGDWQEGQRFPSAVTQQEVTDWVKSLGK